VTTSPVDVPAALSNLVGDAEPASLLPAGRAVVAHVTPPYTLVAATSLGPGFLTVVADAVGQEFVVPLVIEASRVRRAVAGDGLGEALVDRLADGDRLGHGFELDVLHTGAAGGERAIHVDQTHESVIIGDRAVVKWAVVAEPGEQPAPQRLRALDAAGFTAIPQPWAFVTYRGGRSGDVLVASVAQYLPGAQDGWTWCVADVRALVDGTTTLPASVEPPAQIGTLTAQMHASLAASTSLTSADVEQARRWASEARAVLDEAVAIVDADEGLRLRARAPAIGADLDRLAEAAPTPLIEVHGDFHVGQVLRYPGPDAQCYAFNDFDGNPVLSPAQRLERQPAARDVAAMLASLDHVGRVVIGRTDGADAIAVRSWIPAAQHAFLDAYRRGLHAAGRTDLFDERLLRPMMAEQECREFVYAVRHLPHWRYVPDATLAAMYPDPDEV